MGERRCRRPDEIAALRWAGDLGMTVIATADPEHSSIVKLSDGETLRVRGGHDDVAARLSRTRRRVTIAGWQNRRDLY